MSNEFQVHNFYNYDVEELEEIKQEFDSLWENAYYFKKAIADLPNHKTYDEWEKEWQHCEDVCLYEEAEEYYKEKSEVSNG